MTAAERDGDLESRLSLHAQAFNQLEPSPDLRTRIAARIAIRSEAGRRRPAVLRELALAAGVVLFAGTVAFGANYLRTVGANAPSQMGKAKSSDAMTTPQTLSPIIPGQVSPSQVEGILKTKVTTVRPLLLVTAVPAGASAFVTADANGYTVEYRTKTVGVVLSTGVSYLPPGGTPQQYRGVQAVYEATNPAAPEEGQFLSWTEPGQSSLSSSGVPYFLKVGGMTQAEFRQVANSIRPIGRS
jgi:hypothetical protein